MDDEPDNPYDEYTPQWLLWEKMDSHRRVADRAFDTAAVAKSRADEYKVALEKLK